MSKKQNSSDTKAGYYGYSSETTSAENHAKSNSGSKKSVKAKDPTKGSKAGKIVGIVLVLIQLALSITDVYLFLTKDFAFITPTIVGVTILILLVLLGLVFFLLQKSKNAQTFGKIISVIVIILLALACFFLFRDFSKFTNGKKLDNKPFVVFVSANDTFGEFNRKSLGRSDTNILAVVNPKLTTF